MKRNRFTKVSDRFDVFLQTLFLLILLLGFILPVSAESASPHKIRTAPLNLDGMPSTTSTVEGWSWNQETVTLTLSGATIILPAVEAGDSVGINLGIAGKIVLEAGTTNIVRCGDALTGSSTGIASILELDIEGAGELILTGGNAQGTSYGIQTTNLTISDGTLHIKSGNSNTAESIAIRTNWGQVTGGTVNVQGGTASGLSAGIYGLEASISSGSFTAVGGTSLNGNSSGISTDILITNGGQLSAMGGKGAVASYGIFNPGSTLINGGLIRSQGGIAPTVQAFNNPPVIDAGVSQLIGADHTGSFALYGPTAVYGGRVVTDGLVFAPGVPDDSRIDKGIAWDGSTLTLTDAVIAATGSPAVRLTGPATVVANGHNVLKGGDTSSGDSFGLYGSGPTVIQGTGKMTAISGKADIGSSYGLYIGLSDGFPVSDLYSPGDSSLTIHNGAVEGIGGIAYETSCGIFAGQFRGIGGQAHAIGGYGLKRSLGLNSIDTTDISGATLLAVGGHRFSDTGGLLLSSSGIETSHFTINAGSVTTIGGNSSNHSYGILSSDCTISGGKVIAMSDSTPTASNGIFSRLGFSSTGGKLTAIADSGGLESCGINSMMGDITLNGGDIIAISDKAVDSYGIYTDQTTTIQNGTILALAGVGTHSYGIYTIYGDIQGGVCRFESQAAASDSYGLYAKYTLKITGGSVTASGGNAAGSSAGISVDYLYIIGTTGMLDINGGTISAQSASAANSNGIRTTYGPISITDGTVVSNGGSSANSTGISGGAGVNVSGGMLDVAGTGYALWGQKDSDKCTGIVLAPRVRITEPANAGISTAAGDSDKTIRVGSADAYTEAIVTTLKTDLAPGTPTAILATAGNGEASVSFTPSADPVNRPITGYAVTATPGGLTATGASSPITVSGLANGTAYTFTVTAANAAGNSAASTSSNAVTPKAVPGAPTGVAAVAGNGQAVVSFTAPDNGGSPITNYTVISTPGGLTATGASSPITVSGLVNGTAYTFTVAATNALGDSISSASSNSVTPNPPAPAPASSTAGGGGGADSRQPSNERPSTVGTVVTVTEGGRITDLITVDPAVIARQLATSENGTPVTLLVNSASGSVVARIDGETAQSMGNRGAVMEFRTASANYTLPMKLIDIGAVLKRFGQNATLKDLAFSVEIRESSDQTVQFVESVARQRGFALASPPLSFTVNCHVGNRTLEVNSFSAYVERTVVLNTDMNPGQVTTGVAIEADGTLRPVPTRIFVLDGKHYARIRSLSNSVYAVICSPVSFKDADGHWAKTAINDMGSRLVVSGIEKDRFEPDRLVTRAEFATMLTRALGLPASTAAKLPFTDVSPDSWYGPYIGTAYEHSLVSGYDAVSFKPNAELTREQAFVMMARALTVVKGTRSFTPETIQNTLAAFGDRGNLSDYAQTGVATLIMDGVISGRGESMIDPLTPLTRAEAAVLFQRLLLTSGLL